MLDQSSAVPSFSTAFQDGVARWQTGDVSESERRHEHCGSYREFRVEEW